MNKRSTARALAFVLIVSLFFLWGVANNLNDILIKQFKKAFELSDFSAGLVQSAFYLGYFIFALPAGQLIRSIGYKKTVIAGLLLYACGAFLFYPAAQSQSYGFFLMALFVIASGLAMLETSANPLVTTLGPPEGGVRRLNFAQSFNPLGSLAGVLIGQQFILSGIEHSHTEMSALSLAEQHAYKAAETVAVIAPYEAIGVCVLALSLVIALTPFPTAHSSVRAAEAGPHRGSESLRRLLQCRPFRLAVLAQFFYVGAQVGIWSFLIRYVQDTVPAAPERFAAALLAASLICFMAGRFLGTAVMRRVSPANLLSLYALINVGLAAVSVLDPGRLGVGCLIACSFFMSIMFPTIFALGLTDIQEQDRQFGSSLIVMTIVGGALFPALMGEVSDVAGIPRAMALPALCFGVVLVFALNHRRRQRMSAAEVLGLGSRTLGAQQR